MNRTALAVSFAAGLVTLGVSAAHAQAPAPATGYPPQPFAYPAGIPVQPAPEHVHDGGFFFRLQLGAGFTYTTYPSEDLTWSGPAIDTVLSLGLSLPSSVALHFDMLVDRTLSLDVNLAGSSSSVTNVTYSTIGFGVGGSYYTAGNAFLTGGFGLAVASLDYDDGTPIADSDIGVYLTVGAGREWWVARRFAIGVAGRLTIFSLPDQGVDARFTTLVPSVALSMTYD